MLKITVNGVDYPCRITMGAFLEFKRQTDREASEMSSASLSDMVTFIWCCVKSASRADKVEFPYTLEEFADATDPDTLNAFYAPAVDDSKKKEVTESPEA